MQCDVMYNVKQKVLIRYMFATVNFNFKCPDILYLAEQFSRRLISCKAAM